MGEEEGRSIIHKEQLLQKLDRTYIANGPGEREGHSSKGENHVGTKAPKKFTQ